MRKLTLTLLAVGAIVLGIWGVRWLFPNDEAQIRGLLEEVAETASVSPGESNLGRLASAYKLSGFFTSNVVINLHGMGRETRQVSSRAELRGMLVAARTEVQRARIQLLDPQLHLAPDHLTAVVYLTVLGDVDGRPAAIAQELECRMRKEDRHWRIARVDTVKVLDP